MHRMENLEKLVLEIPEYHSPLFEIAFKRAGLILPNVRTLKLAPFCEFAIALCPNVRTISTNGWRWVGAKRADASQGEHTLRLFRAAGNAPKLEYMETTERWNIPLVESILENMANLPQLDLGGSLQVCFCHGLIDFLRVLARFQNLQWLALPDAVSLIIKSRRPPCAYNYEGLHGSKLKKAVEADAREVEMKVAVRVAEACPKLKELWFGHRTKVEILRSLDGSFQDVIVKLHRQRERAMHVLRIQ